METGFLLKLRNFHLYKQAWTSELTNRKKRLKYIYERTEAIEKKKKRNWDERQFSSLLIYNILVSGLAHLKDILYILQLENTIFLKGRVGYEYNFGKPSFLFLTYDSREHRTLFHRVFIVQKTFDNVFKVVFNNTYCRPLLTLSLKYHLAVLSDMVSLAVKVTMSVDPSFNEQMLNIE